ncbi:hypothetical protein HPP92_008058 [Vanilla planifolia]|uniref:Uncharacterized protein n=1 Tax=Vanilla planifolia TaxID=51239 RepID=A0A835RF78_VANPL|nr:hypothetical protein HPP92_008058 [Vanilla planifolia]
MREFLKKYGKGSGSREGNKEARTDVATRLKLPGVNRLITHLHKTEFLLPHHFYHFVVDGGKTYDGN